MKKMSLAIIAAFIFQFIAFQCHAVDNCVSDGCYTSKGVLIQCGGSWDDSYGGVQYHCTCQCGSCDHDPSVCVAVSAGGAGAGATVQTNMGSDINGTAFFSSSPAYEIGAWADDNDQKWQAFRARALQGGYLDMSSFINGGTSGMPFNDFVYQATLKYLNNNYFNNGSGDSRLMRGDSQTPNASFYTSNDNGGSGKNGGGGPTPVPKPGAAPGITDLDDGGLYLNGKTPMLLRGADEDITFEERERNRLSSVVDTLKLKKMDDQSFDDASAEAEKADKTSDENGGIYSKVSGILRDKLDAKMKAAGTDSVIDLLSGGNETAKKVMGDALDVYDSVKDIKDSINLAMAGQDEALASKNLGNGEKLLLGQLKGMQGTVAKYTTKIYDTFARKTIDDVGNIILKAPNQLQNNYDPNYNPDKPARFPW